LKTEPVTTDTDTVPRLLRLLPPRERLRVVAEVLPELEDELPATAVSADFWQGSEIGVLAEGQGVEPVRDLAVLLGGWPEDESVDDFLVTLRHWRQQNPAELGSR